MWAWEKSHFGSNTGLAYSSAEWLPADGLEGFSMPHLHSSAIPELKVSTHSSLRIKIATRIRLELRTCMHHLSSRMPRSTQYANQNPSRHRRLLHQLRHRSPLPHLLRHRCHLPRYRPRLLRDRKVQRFLPHALYPPTVSPIHSHPLPRPAHSLSAHRWVFLAYLTCVIIFNAAATTQRQATGIAMLSLTLFFESVCFPTIVALGIRGIGRHTKRGSGLIVAGVSGGAVVPPILGASVSSFARPFRSYLSSDLQRGRKRR